MSTTTEPEYLNVRELAAKFRASRAVVYRGVKDGWPCARVGGIKFSPEHVEAIKSLIEAPVPDTAPKRRVTEADIARALKKTVGRTRSA